MVWLNCYICKKDFKHKGAGQRPKTCPGECRSQHRKSLAKKSSKNLSAKEKEKSHSILKSCKYCGSEFTRKKGRTFYCSLSCSKKAASKQRNSKRRARLNSVDYDAPVYPSELVKRDGENCCHCGESFTGENPSEIDHIIPVNRGGVHAAYNCQLLCRTCNNKKGARIPLYDLKKANELWPAKPNISERDPRRCVLTRKVKAKSGYRGVIKVPGGWRCKLEYKKKVYQKGTFKTAEDAAIQYNKFCEMVGIGIEYQNEVNNYAESKKTG